MFGQKKIEKYGELATVVAIVVVSFYITGLYKNVLEIKKIKKDNDSK